MIRSDLVASDSGMASDSGISVPIVGQTKLGIGAFDGAIEGAVGAVVILLSDGLLDGATVILSDGAGDEVGLRLGLEVKWRMQAVSLESTHVGANESNCWIVSNTEENGHSIPLLLLTKFRLLVNVLPKTTISDAPTILSRKHVFSTVVGPSDSMIKLWVSGLVLFQIMSLFSNSELSTTSRFCTLLTYIRAVCAPIPKYRLSRNSQSKNVATSSFDGADAS